MNLKRLVKIGFLSLLVVALVAAESEAQRKKKGERGGRRGGFGQRGGFGRGMFSGGGALGLLRQESVQKELKINDEQKKKITSATEELNEKRRDMFQDFRDLSREERQDLRKEMTEMSQKAEKTAVAVLKKEQKERLDQLVLQQSGARALQQEDLQKKLDLSKKQNRKIASLFESQQDKQRELFQELRDGSGDFSDMREKMQEMRKKLDKDVLGVLNKKQAEQFEKMKGKKFNFQRRRRRPDV